ncbi:MAG: hypothetical protein JWO47_452 [Candidatus Saccharibacteria bacterium]|nr:hypothetical protein [Candidatus Saccharibacteria bacterium]
MFNRLPSYPFKNSCLTGIIQWSNDFCLNNTGGSSSGKTLVFGTSIRGFESLTPSHENSSPKGGLFSWLCSCRIRTTESCGLWPPKARTGCLGKSNFDFPARSNPSPPDSVIMDPMNGSSEINKHYWLYVLLLEQNKYYIGITSKKDPQDRIKEHMNGFYSSQWAKKYKPIKAVEIIDIGTITKDDADRLELQRTLQYMKKYGYQNVRGGKLNYSGKYLKIGNRFLAGETASTIAVVLFLLLVIAILVGGRS